MSEETIVTLQDVRDQRLAEQYFEDLDRIDAYAAQIPVSKEVSFAPACTSNPTKKQEVITIVICEGPIGSRMPVNGFRLDRKDWEKLRDVCDRMFAAIAP